MQDRRAWLFLQQQEDDGSEPDDMQIDLSAAHLAGRLPAMTLKQLQRIVRRFSPGVSVGRRYDAIQEIRMVLASPDLLARLYAGLSPMELMILQLLKRRGGQARGWELYTGAVLRGFSGQDHDPQPETYYYGLRPSAAIEFLEEMIADGLLLVPDSLGLDYYDGTDHATVTADEALLTHLPPAALPAVLKLDLPERPAEGIEGRHPAGVVLEVLDVLQLTANEGGLDVTRTRNVAKPFLRRLEKQRPHLAAQLPRLLRFLPVLGLVRSPADDRVKQPWQVDPEQLASFVHLPLTFMYASVVDASATVSDAEAHQYWQNTMYGTATVKQFWTAMLQALPVLPEHPVAAADAASALWASVMEPVFAHSGRLALHRTPPLSAIVRMLTGVMPELGLLSYASGAAGTGEQLVVPGPGAAWHTQARAIVEGCLEVPGPSLQQVEAELESAGPALLIQPDFSVLVYLDRLTSGAVQALLAASLERLDLHTATMRIDRSSVNYALEAGTDVEELTARFAAHAQEVPVNVATAIKDWAARRDRLRLHVRAQFIEYPGPAERDAALPRLPGAKPLAERFILLDPSQPVPAFDHDYSLDPDRVLSVDGTGLIKAQGPLDLPARTLLKNITEQVSARTFRIIPERIRSGALNPQLQEILEQRSAGPLPQELTVMLKAWSGQTPAPALTGATLFQHPEATGWAAHARIGPLLGPKLNSATYLVSPGREAELRQLLDELGISPTSGTDTVASVAAQAAADALETGLSTRKTREMIEQAIEYGQQLQLRYAYERRDRTRGRIRTEKLIPEQVVYQGSTPYLLAVTVTGDTDRVIRIGFVEGIGVVEQR